MWLWLWHWHSDTVMEIIRWRKMGGWHGCFAIHASHQGPLCIGRNMQLLDFFSPFTLELVHLVPDLSWDRTRLGINELIIRIDSLFIDNLGNIYISGGKMYGLIFENFSGYIKVGGGEHKYIKKIVRLNTARRLGRMCGRWQTLTRPHSRSTRLIALMNIYYWNI